MSKVLVINPILYTAENNRIPQVDSIKDTMIYTMCQGFREAGHEVTLIGPGGKKVILFPFCGFIRCGAAFFNPDVFPICLPCAGF